jgi:hypothetical protein
VAGGVAFGMIAAALAVGMIRGAKGEPHAVQGAEPVAQAAAEPASIATAAPTTSVPVISVDSLPVAPSAQQQAVQPARGTGRLFISSAPNWCTISVDGMKRGPTPLPAIDLSAGPHVLRCDSPSGKSRTASIVVTEGATGRYKFNLD